MISYCNHDPESKYTTIEVRYFPGETNDMWYATCTTCGVHTDPVLTVTKAKELAADGYLKR